MLHDPLGLLGGDLGHDAAHGFHQDEADFLLLDARVVLDRRAGKVFHLGDALDAGEAATNHHEGEGAGALGRISDGGAGFDPLEDLVAQRNGFLDGLQADSLVRKALDGEGAGNGTSGQYDVEVRHLKVRAAVGRGNHRGPVGVVDRGDAALDEFRLLQVLTVRDDSVARLDVSAGNFRQEGLVGHVGQRINDSDDATGIRDLVLQFEGYVQADVPAADDEYPGTVLELWGCCHDSRIQ
ncbi:hypothetical protein D9M72_456300 [compost metagenome]